MKNLKVVLLGVALACSTFVIAEDLPDRGPVSFGAYDTDGDGIITRSEFNSLKERRMNQKEEQGRLMRNAYMSPVFEDVDTNKDGMISKNELRIHQQTRLQDRDRDRLQDRNRDMMRDRDMMHDRDMMGSGSGSGTSGSGGSGGSGSGGNK